MKEGFGSSVFFNTFLLSPMSVFLLYFFPFFFSLSVPSFTSSFLFPFFLFFFPSFFLYFSLLLLSHSFSTSLICIHSFTTFLPSFHYFSTFLHYLFVFLPSSSFSCLLSYIRLFFPPLVSEFLTFRS